MLELVFQSLILSFSRHPAILFFFFKNNVLINFQWSLNSRRLPHKCFHKLLYFSSFGCARLFWQGLTKKQRQGDQREKCYLLFHQFKCVVSKQFNSGRTKVSTVKKTNRSPRQNAEVCRIYDRRNIERFLLSLYQFLCGRIAEANWKILKLPLHFRYSILSTWISEAGYVPLRTVQCLNCYLI